LKGAKKGLVLPGNKLLPVEIAVVNTSLCSPKMALITYAAQLIVIAQRTIKYVQYSHFAVMKTQNS
jgi:hypothetical protein